MLPKSLRPLKPYLWKYRWQYIFSAFTVVANNAIWVLFPLVIKKAIGDPSDPEVFNAARDCIAP